MEALLTPEQVAKRLQLTPHTIYVWLRAGRLRGIKLGHLWRVKEEDLDAYLDRASSAPQTGEEKGTDLMDLVRLAEEYMSNVPEEEWERLPKDLCDNLDHYLYGLPRKDLVR